MSLKDKQTMYWTVGIVLVVIIVAAVYGYTSGWFTAAPGQG